MNDIWYDSQVFYKYDPERDLYEQVWDIVEKKLKWYSLIFKKHVMYTEAEWGSYTLNERYTLITTITNPKIEEGIKKCKTEKDKEEVFNYIVWHIPYFTRRSLKGDKKIFPNQPSHKIINRKRYKCPPEIFEPDDNWYESDVFEMYGRALNTNNVTIYINQNYEDYEVFVKRFMIIKNTKVSSINDIISENKDIVKITLRCTATTIRHCDNAFKNCKSLVECDLSNINLNYCESLENMFRGCINLQTIDFSGLDLNVLDPDTSNMFIGCHSLNKIIMNTCSDSTITQMKCILNRCGLENVKIQRDW